MGEKPTLPRSTFNSTFNKLTTFDAGQLIPFLLDEILPGDHMKYNVTAFLRMATPLFPIFSSQRIDTHIFFVPNRLLWSNWKKMMGEQASPGASIAYTVPIMTPDVVAQFTLADYLGIPIGTMVHEVNSLPFRAYNLIYNEWFRDENIVSPLPFGDGNGPDTYATYAAIAQRAKTHDYFTSCLPWPQKFTAPTVPITGKANVQGIGTGGTYPLSAQAVFDSELGSTTYPFAVSAHAAIYARGSSAGPSADPTIFTNFDAQGVGFTINAFREANAIQVLLERDARGGTRYIEMIKAQFGVTSPDARQQRPEYIGGGSTPLNITPIAQTATGGGGLGALGAAAAAVGDHSATYAATEHGYIIGLVSVKSELQYQQGLHRMFTRSTRYDFYFPPLANLGEQAVLRRELLCTNTATDDNMVFGYQERWQEYRVRYSEITAAFRSIMPGSLDAWHLGQEFAPGIGGMQLDQDFIEDLPPMTRVLAAGASADHQQYFADIQIKRSATRVLPMFSTPSLGRF